MKKRYLIDGNNLLHKIPKLSRNNNTDSRLTLALKVDRYFTGKILSVPLFLTDIERI